MDILIIYSGWHGGFHVYASIIDGARRVYKWDGNKKEGFAKARQYFLSLEDE